MANELDGAKYLKDLFIIQNTAGLDTLLAAEQADQVRLIFGRAQAMLANVEPVDRSVYCIDSVTGIYDWRTKSVRESVVAFSHGSNACDLVLTNGRPGKGDKIGDDLATLHIRVPGTGNGDQLLFGPPICTLNAAGDLVGEQNLANIGALLDLF